ncbi:hypothetical protein I7I48_07435 [Histoplasma ohiense]|nr:hypothetical protein I7I48_07435 [Histoplasma ohiense (nom. inval.)]
MKLQLPSLSSLSSRVSKCLPAQTCDGRREPRLGEKEEKEKEEKLKKKKKKKRGCRMTQVFPFDPQTSSINRRL